MDLNKLDLTAGANAGAEINLLHPGTGKPTDLFITILGADGDKWQALQDDRQRELLESSAQEVTVSDRLKAAKEAGLNMLVAMVLSWRNFELAGAALECTPANVKMVLLKYPWIKEQLDIAVGKRANFLKP